MPWPPTPPCLHTRRLYLRLSTSMRHRHPPLSPTAIAAAAAAAGLFFTQLYSPSHHRRHHRLATGCVASRRACSLGRRPRRGIFQRSPRALAGPTGGGAVLEDWLGAEMENPRAWPRTSRCVRRSRSGSKRSGCGCLSTRSTLGLESLRAAIGFYNCVYSQFHVQQDERCETGLTRRPR